MGTPESHPHSAPRLPGLDLLRAFAIVWVMVYHASLFDLAPANNWFVDFGWMGVDLFFVLSGFLIAGQLLRPWAQGRAPDYPRFFTRRLLRTLPAYLVIVALCFLIPPIRDRAHIQPLWQFLTFTQNFGLDPHPPKAFSHAWSLCVEEQFYLVFPIAVAWIAARPSAAKVIGAIVALLAFGMALRGWLWLHDVAREPFNLEAQPSAVRYMMLIYYPTWTRLDGLLAGIAAAALQVLRPRWWARFTARPNLLLAVGATSVVASAVLFRDQIGGFFAAVFGYPLIAFSMALLVAGGTAPRSLIGRRAVPGAAALAAGSYSLYLSHKLAFHALAETASSFQPAAMAWRLPIALAGAVLAGAALYWGIERPFLRLRDRLGGATRTPMTSEPATIRASA